VCRAGWSLRTTARVLPRRQGSPCLTGALLFAAGARDAPARNSQQTAQRTAEPRFRQLSPAQQEEFRKRYRQLTARRQRLTPQQQRVITAQKRRPNTTAAHRPR
jgi:hypothetical protein